MSPLKITFALGSPMVEPERPLHLDGLLGAAQFRIAARGGSDDPVAESADLDTVLEKAREGDSWVWKASQLQIEANGARFWNHYGRRFEVTRWADDKTRGVWLGGKNRIEDGSGSMKSFFFQQPLLHVTRVLAWCVGDREMVEFLLRTEIDSLGRNARMGWGRVTSVAVEPAPADEAEYWRRRTLPLAFGAMRLPEHHQVMSTVNPPYWDRSKWQPSWEYVHASAAVANASP